MLEEDWFYWIS